LHIEHTRSLRVSNHFNWAHALLINWRVSLFKNYLIT